MALVMFIGVLYATYDTNIQSSVLNKQCKLHIAKDHGKLPLISKENREKYQQLFLLLWVRGHWNVTF